MRRVRAHDTEEQGPNWGGICRRGHKKGHTLIQSVFGVSRERPQPRPRINRLGA
jgi:hypothetical protein